MEQKNHILSLPNYNLRETFATKNYYHIVSIGFFKYQILLHLKHIIV